MNDERATSRSRCNAPLRCVAPESSTVSNKEKIFSSKETDQFQQGKENSLPGNLDSQEGNAPSRHWQPYPTYKDSGAPWLGEIPTHWETKRLKFLTTDPLQYGANEPAQIDDPDLPRYIRITDVKEDGSLHDDTFRSLPYEIARPYLLEPGDLLLARSGATVGKSFLYQESWGTACYAGYLIRLRPDITKIVPRFVSYFVNSSLYWNWISTILIQFEFR